MFVLGGSPERIPLDGLPPVPDLTVAFRVASVPREPKTVMLLRERDGPDLWKLDVLDQGFVLRAGRSPVESGPQGNPDDWHRVRIRLVPDHSELELSGTLSATIPMDTPITTKASELLVGVDVSLVIRHITGPDSAGISMLLGDPLATGTALSSIGSKW